MSASFVRMFKAQFAALVESGAKCQTVRPTPKRMPKPGDRISLRCWTGRPYLSKQRVLREAVITEVTPIELCFLRCRLLIWIRGERSKYLKTPEIEAFAKSDGFQDAAEMAHWFQTEHGLPFSGVLIKWGSDVSLVGAEVCVSVTHQPSWLGVVKSESADGQCWMVRRSGDPELKEIHKSYVRATE